MCKSNTEEQVLEDIQHYMISVYGGDVREVYIGFSDDSKLYNTPSVAVVPRAPSTCNRAKLSYYTQGMRIPIRTLYVYYRFFSSYRPHSFVGVASLASVGARTFFSASSFASSPFWCIETRMSHPPTNSLSMYSCGIVGQSEYSLIPIF